MPPPRAAPGGGITRKYDKAASNPFRVGGKNYFVDYRFTAPAPAALGTAAARPGVPKIYEGTAQVDQKLYNAIRLGQSAPVRYEVTNPAVSGIDSRQAGRNIRGGSALLSGWLLYPFATLCAGLVLLGLWERIRPHEG